MLTPEEIRKVDRSSVCSIYDQWPEYCKIKESALDLKDVSNIVLTGMGGSGTSADIIYDLLTSRSDIPVYVVKGYHIPKFVKSNTLIIAISVSGNTEETLSTLLEAHDRGAEIVGISDGGEMANICSKFGLNHVKIKQLVYPRFTLPAVLYSALNVISNIDSLAWLKREIDDSLIAIGKVRDNIAQYVEYEKNPAKQLAKSLHGYIPVIYCSPLSRGTGIRFKGALNENAKAFALTSEILESSHNEIVPWSNQNESFKAVFVRNAADTAKIKIRFNLFREILEGYGHDIYDTPINGSSALASIVSSLYLLDYASIYLAVLRGIDPAPIDAITKLKGLMKIKEP